MIGVEVRVVRVELVRNVAAHVERTGLGQSLSVLHGCIGHAHALVLVRGDVGAQAAEIARRTAPLRGGVAGERPHPRTPGVSAPPCKRILRRASSDIGSPHDWRANNGSPHWPAGNRYRLPAGGRCRSARIARGGCPHANTRAWNAASSTSQPGHERGAQASAATPAICSARGHLIMNLTKVA